MFSTKLFRYFVIGILLSASWLLPLQVTHAGMIGTDTLLTEAAQKLDRAVLRDMLARDDVAAQLEAHGVDTEAARLRVERMTDEEVIALNNRLDHIPAGGDLVGAALVVFIVLVITDVIGATDVFPFIRPVTN